MEWIVAYVFIGVLLGELVDRYTRKTGMKFLWYHYLLTVFVMPVVLIICCPIKVLKRLISR